MGYKYGVWLIYDKYTFPTTHIGHFTITCFMEKIDACSLYKKLLATYGKTHYIDVNGRYPLVFDKNMYEDDNNDMGSWGYEGKQYDWDNFKKCTIDYDCNFSHTPHTSIEYYKTEECTPIIRNNVCVECHLAVADITDDDPLKWTILEK